MSNKKIKAELFTSLLLTFAGAQFANAQPTAGAYVDDEQRIYIEGQPLTEAVQVAEEIVCSLSAMRPGAFVDKGAYVAKYYDGRCNGTGADLASESAAATPTSAASKSTASSATSVAGNTAELAELATLEVVSGEQAGVVRGKTWITLLSEGEGDPDQKLYINTELTEGVSAASPNGEFELWFSSHVFGDSVPTFLLDSGGGVVGQGYLKASGTEITFKEANMGGEGNLALSISASGDAEGIFSRSIGGCENCSDPSNAKYFGLQANYQFNIDAGQKQFCRNLQSVSVVCNGDANDLDVCAGAEDTRVTDVNDENYNGFEALRVPVSLTQYMEPFLSVADNRSDLALDISGELIVEECFSTNKSDATKNIYRYGVYDANGDRLTMAKEGEVSSFSMFADVGVDAVDETIVERVYGYASYNGIYLDPRGRELIVPGVTEFKKEDVGSAVASSSDAYVVSETEVLVEKRTTEYVSLASLNKIKLSLYVGDPYWAAEFTALLGVDPAASGYEQLIGSYNAVSADFTMHTVVTQNPYSEVLLITPIVFSREDWLVSMEKDYGDWTEIRSMGVWSNDTRQWYEISAAALADPTLILPQLALNSGLTECPADIWSTTQIDSCRGGVKTEMTDFISLSALSDKKLACIENCLEPSLMQTTYLTGYCGTEEGQNDSATCAGVVDTSPLPTPFANVGPFIKKNVMVGSDSYNAGEYRDGIRASNVVKYEVSDDKSGFEVGGVVVK
ncbi:MAG: hypothetical protein ACI90U_003078 [Pseudomonadales bacterium]|jgi:hypothetical protein